MTSTLVTGIGELATVDGTGPDGLGLRHDAAVVVEGGVIAWVGPAREAPGADRRVDVDGRAVVPGFVDSHSHLVFAGDRAAEFEARMTGEPYTAVERRVELIVRPGGKPEECYLDFVYRRVDDKQGAPYGVLICVNDVTERVRARLQLVDALRARDDLLSICSHELKTPVASMKLSTQMFKRGLQRGDARSTSPERVARMVDQSDRQLDRLTRLIDEILDFSRINGGQLRLQPAPCDLAAIVSETLERLRPQIESAGAVVTVDLGSAARGQWDTFRLEQLLTNLLTNAVKYGAGKPIHVKLSQADDQVILEVRDQGPGISEADQRRIFLPYERAVSVHNISGLGLGLYIAQQIVVAHNGSIEVESAPGEGCSFVVHLPRNGMPPPQNAQGT